jgi:hypothetical protein
LGVVSAGSAVHAAKLQRGACSDQGRRAPAFYLGLAGQFAREKQWLEAGRCYDMAGLSASSKRQRREHTFMALVAFQKVWLVGWPRTGRLEFLRAGLRFLSEHPRDEKWLEISFNVGRAEVEGGAHVSRGLQRLTALAKKYPDHKLADVAVALVLGRHYYDAKRSKAYKRLLCRRLSEVASELLRAVAGGLRLRKPLRQLSQPQSCSRSFPRGL